MMASRVISPNGLKTGANGVSIDVRLPWYRSLPLSVVDVAELKIDGVAVKRDQIRFELNGQSRKLDDLASLSNEEWYVLDSAFLNIEGLDVKPGSEHDIDVTLSLCPPYIKGFTRLTRQQKTLQAV